MTPLQPVTVDSSKSFLAEFKDFAVKGNAIQLSVAVVVGNAFTQIVNALVGDIITPLLGLLTGNSQTDFKNLALTLRGSYMENGTTVPALTLQYGAFIQSIFNFLVIAFSIFVVFKILAATHRRIRGPEKKPAREKTHEEILLEEIRDVLKSRG